MKNGYRIGEWKKRSENLTQSVIYTEDSPENRKQYHNLIEAFYIDGEAYFINASDK